jgi:hypothetical protein
MTDELGPPAQSHPARPGGRPLPHDADHDCSPPSPPAELTASVLTGDGWATIVVRAPGDIEVVSWPVTTGGRCELALVDALARLELAARRWGCAIRLRGAEDELLGLIDLVGLKAVLTGPPPSGGVERAGEAEGLEQLEVEEVVVADDPPA